MKIKQVIVVRKDLNISRGKLAAQVAHASVSALERAREISKEWVREWFKEGQKKVVLEVDCKEKLLEIYAKALGKRLPAALIRDMGLTELLPGTMTAVGIGPAPEDAINTITGKLKLLK